MVASQATLRRAMDQRLSRIFADVFQFEGPLSDALGPDGVEGWNSFGHLALVEALEAEFGVHIPEGDIADMDNVGNIKRVLARHGAQAA